MRQIKVPINSPYIKEEFTYIKEVIPSKAAMQTQGMEQELERSRPELIPGRN